MALGHGLRWLALKAARGARALTAWRRAVALDILGFFLTLFAGGVLYIVFQNLVNALSTYQATYYNSGQFIATDLAAYTYGWLALPAIILISALVGLLLGAQKRGQVSRI